MPSRRRLPPVVSYVAPFAAFVALRWLPVAPEWLAPARLLLVAAAIVVFSRRVLPAHPSHLARSVLLGAAVLAVWIAPDLVWPRYREFWLFHNAVTGAARSSLPPGLRRNVFFIAVRMLESAVLVPVLEELFWRGWLMRWLIDPDFENVPMGRYTSFSFWAVAVLFASEHGPYWDVGLIAGVAYNWWLVRTRSLADCMVAHAVTNALLGVYVLACNQWQYWM
ncbi:MAG TPA: CAAX prenyl protease-related protein [Bryobacteraceae bacterium]|nr:CAAX prenyl protease-related protein [Bryobacteraceae bacterium]